MRLFRSLYEFSVTGLFAIFLRLHALGQDVRFHPDEAFFATFARNAATFGEWMLPGGLDKTPLSMYAGALSMHFTAAHTTSTGIIDVSVRAGEFAARLPSVFAGIILVFLIAALGNRLYGRQAGIIAALIVALSPYAIVFSAAAFTDMLMVTLLTAALWMAALNRPSASGVALALAFASKQQAVLYLPLILGLSTILHGFSWRWLGHFILGVLPGVAALIAWDALRPGTSIFALAAANNQPGSFFVAPSQWLERISTWSQYGGWLLGPPLVTGGLVIASLWPARCNLRPLTLLLWGYIAAYALLHVVVGFNTYDRYLLPLLPPLALLSAHTLAHAIGHAALPSQWRQFAAAILLLIMGITAYQASSTKIDLGRDHYPPDRAGEIITLANYVNARPLGTIIYSHWLGWELEYYLGAWSDKRRVYYPDPVTQAQDALLNPDPAPRYMVAPAQADVTAWLEALAAAGFTLNETYRTGLFVAYTVIPPWTVQSPSIAR